MEYRMYNFVLKSLSTIQKGVQALHSTVDYAIKYGNNEDFKHWADIDKTTIVLDGGNCPELEDIETTFNYFKIKHTVFKEPDLNNIITSISVLVPDYIYKIDRDDYNSSEYVKNLNESDGIIYEFISTKHLAR